MGSDVNRLRDNNDIPTRVDNRYYGSQDWPKSAKFVQLKRVLRRANEPSLLINEPVSLYDNSKSFMHHKFAVIDDQLVINGSYNWTKGARFENKENLTLTNSPKAVQGFKGEFERLWAEFA